MLVIGAVTGWLCNNHFRGEAGMVQRDTVTVLKKVHYSRLELDANRYRLDIPDVDVKEYVVMQVDSIIYKDNIVYASAPREYCYTKVDDAEIWHSGIDSRIDSLNVFRKSTIITERIQPVTRRNALELGIEAGYDRAFRLPLHLEYSYKVGRWFSAYGYGEYDLLNKNFGIGAGARLAFEW